MNQNVLTNRFKFDGNLSCLFQFVPNVTSCLGGKSRRPGVSARKQMMVQESPNNKAVEGG